MAFVRFGFHFASVTPLASDPARLFANIVEVASAAEEGGFDSVFVPDHVLQNQAGGGPTTPMLEAYTLLGALAARTERLNLGALVSPVTFRNPAMLAKTVSTLDVISAGRAILGIGAGWDTAEHAAYGFSFPGVGERMDRLEEALRICRAMLGEEAPSVSGAHYSIEAALNVPRPLRGRIPILVGGSGERRTLRLVAGYADACNVSGDAETLRHKLSVLQQHCESIGRDPGEITKTGFVFGPKSVDDLRARTEVLFESGIEAAIVAGTAPDAATVRTWGQSLQAAFG